MTAPMTPDEARMRELAEAATQGEWIFELEADGDGDWELSAKTPDLADTGDTEHLADVTSRRDATFIAAANPATILALLDALSAERERGEPIGWIKRTNERHPIGLTQPSDWKFSPHRPALGEGLQAEWFDVHPVCIATQSTSRTGEG